MPSVTIAAIGGQQQSAIAQAFAAKGWTVRGTRRDPGPGDDAIRADLDTGEGLAHAFEGADAVVLTLPQDHRDGVMARIARNVARAAADAGVGRIVLNPAVRIDDHSPVAVYAALRAARDAVMGGSVPAVTIEPTVFLDNLLAPWFLPALQGGTLAYPAAPEARVAWISHRTLAEAVAAAANADVAGEVIAIGGPQALTGPALADIVGQGLGHPVAYAQVPLDAFAAGLDASFGAPTGTRIAEAYAHLAAHPDFMSGGAEGLARLGVVPEDAASFVARNRWTPAA